MPKGKQKSKGAIMLIFILLAASILVIFVAMNAPTTPSNDSGVKDVTNDEDGILLTTDNTQTTNDEGDTWDVGDGTAENVGTTAQVWQTLYVTTDQSSFWVLPPSLYNTIAQQLSIVTLGPSGEQEVVQKIQNNIYMQVSTDKTVTSWTLTCKETMKLGGLENTYTMFADKAIIPAKGTTLDTSDAAWATGATVTGDDFEKIMGNKVQTNRAYHVIITLSDVKLTLKYSDGTSETLVMQAGTEENTLMWYMGVGDVNLKNLADPNMKRQIGETKPWNPFEFLHLWW